MAFPINEIEIMRVQYGDKECLSEVPELGLIFSAPTVDEVKQLALDAIAEKGDDFQIGKDEALHIQLTNELERVEAGIVELQARAERIKVRIKNNVSTSGLKAIEMLEEDNLMDWALRKLTPGHPQKIKSTCFRWWKDLDDDGDMDCCAVFYRGYRIRKPNAAVGDNTWRNSPST